MAVLSTWVGAVTDASVWVRAKLDAGATSATLEVDTDPLFGSPASYGPDTPTADNVVSVQPDDLSPLTSYFYRWSIDTVVDTVTTGRFSTFPVPGTPTSFEFAAAGDAGLEPEVPGVGDVFMADRISNHYVFDTIRTQDPRFFIHLGDIHYYNPSQIIGDTVADLRRCIDDVLLQPRQHQLYREVPLIWSYDDHDYGSNNSDSTDTSRAAGAQVYRERVPHYPLPDIEGAIYHSFQYGRVLFIVTDDRFHRDPNTNPDGPDHVMLGDAQLGWIEDTLAAAPGNGAEALVMVTGVQWHVGGEFSDSWGGFAQERQRLTDILTSSGWADRMVMLQADAHSLAMDDGGSNPYGGWPLYLLASLDCRPSNVSSSFYNVGVSNARNQYGLIEVTDSGAAITLTVRGYNGISVAMTHSVVLFEEEPEPPDPIPPAPPVIAEARIRDKVTWLGVHRSTGRIICDLPDVTGETEQLLAAYATCQLGIPVTSRGSPGHVPIEQILAATHGESGSIVAVVNDLPIWMGLTTARQRGSAGAMRLATATTESYLLKRYVLDHEFAGMDRALVASALVGDAEVMDGVGAGLGFELDVQLTGEAIDRTYVATDRMRVYEALQELAADGLEWRVRYDWADNSQTTVVKILEIARRIGRISGTPQAMFETGGAGSVTTWHIDENWSDGKYANVVTAIGPGQGEDQPASAPAIAQDVLGRGAPIVEHVFTPGRNITDLTALDAHAAAELTRVLQGSMPLMIEAALNAYPRIGVDALPGDQVTYDLTGPGAPDGLAGSARMAGWRMTAGSTWTPLLIEDSTLLEVL